MKRIITLVNLLLLLSTNTITDYAYNLISNLLNERIESWQR